MNKGIIYKIKQDEDGTKYYIRLDRNLKIEDVEYNIYVKLQEDKDHIAKLFRVDEAFGCDFDLIGFFDKKLNFTIEGSKITAVEKNNYNEK